MTHLNVDKFMLQRAQQLPGVQPVINVNPFTIRVPVHTFRQTTKHNSNHNEPPFITGDPNDRPSNKDTSTGRQF
jgi:hypothetical protein